MPDRNVVFISHATPEDNEFVRWLGTRLTGCGYSVWADLFELRGGTPFWSAVERVIRERSARVIVVVSKASCQPDRQGVLNEIALADTLKKQLKDDEFIIPVRIDDVAYSQFPIQIHRLNAIDFTKGWGAKLPLVLESLEAGKVPRAATDKTAEFDRWRAASVRSSVLTERNPEPLHTNILPILRLPSNINFCEYAGENRAFRARCEELPLPVSFHDRLLVSFATADELHSRVRPEFAVSARATVAVEDFLDARLADPVGPRRRDARARLSALLRQGFEDHLADRGLLRHRISAGTVLFFPAGYFEGDRIVYRTMAGRETWKQVCGRSTVLNANWHFGVRAIVKLDDLQIRLKPYVVFTRDGKTPIPDPDEMTRLRRRFCMSWFNNVWSRLFQAFFQFFGQGAEEIGIRLGGESLLIVGGRGVRLEAARSMPSDLPSAGRPEEAGELDPDDLLEEQDDEDEAELQDDDE
jgi:hypothetical protein